MTRPSALALCLILLVASCKSVSDYVDPRIGSEGLGRTTVGPSCPFGMVKPSPDCTSSPNSGWLPMPQRVDGFAQVHVSGTGGGPKYGNILIMPFCGQMEGRSHIAHRKWEDIALGYYACEFEENGIKTEVTTAERASFYRISYPEGSNAGLCVDAGFFLGESPVPGAREAQQFEGSFAEAVSDREIRGWSRISGGWNNGDAYTVYFHLVSDKPFAQTRHLEENGRETVLAGFGKDGGRVNIKVGISFLSLDKARLNAEEQIRHWDFGRVRSDCIAKWEKELSKIKVSGSKAQKRMFYTALYHTMLMPVDRTGEWEKCGPEEPYYDDFYAIWDTYRSSTPLLTLLDPGREVQIVNALLNIYKKDGFLPDARSGNSNGRTQGGSNAEIVIADAFVKGLEGIDYELALEAMIHDAEALPSDDEAEGRGGLEEYNSLGYIPWGIDRAGNRIVEYSICDYAIHTLAKGLGKEDIAAKYLERSGSWKNLWRTDTECEGVRGFIMPRSRDGQWMDELPYGHSERNHPTYRYLTTTFEGPWYTKWWSSFFYEASSWEYSLSVPHDVEGLIEQCGGPESFEKRLDTFFEKGYYNVNNEPSFLSPCLYSWIGKGEKTSSRVLQIIRDNFNDTPSGIPGNDDSGAMSSWLAFHMTGLYPVAGDSLYVVHSPVLRRSVYHLPNGRRLKIVAGRADSPLFITHSRLMRGGRLVVSKCTPAAAPLQEQTQAQAPGGKAAITDTLLFTYKLHGQTRRFAVSYDTTPEGLRMNWTIERNLRLWHGSYIMSPSALEGADNLSGIMPEDGGHIVLPDGDLFAMISRRALRDIHSKGACSFAGTRFRLIDSDGTALGRSLMHLEDIHEGAQMWVLDHPEMPLIWRMEGNPLEQDWSVSSLDALRSEVLSDPRKAGGIYYSYPVSGVREETDAPRGYEPFYLSHYGRHGSRYLTDQRRYTAVLDFFESESARGNLTEEGALVLDKLRILCEETSGRAARLSSIGEQQHRGIALRMAARYPSVFCGADSVRAVSSTKQRCIASMDSFCDALQEARPDLKISRDSSEENMSFIAYTSPTAEEMGKEKTSFWAGDFRRFESENIHPGRLVKALFRKTDGIPGMLLFDSLYWIAEGQQDIPSEIDFFCHFTPDELFGKWRTVNYRMYLSNCNAPLTGCAGARSASSLLSHILDDACEALGSGRIAADLRFGHDTALIRLLALMGVEGACARESDPELFWRSWQDWKISPMGANLQIVFYRNAHKDILVKFLLNEEEVLLEEGPSAACGPYYRWSDLYEYLAAIQRQACEEIEQHKEDAVE